MCLLVTFHTLRSSFDGTVFVVTLTELEREGGR